MGIESGPSGAVGAVSAGPAVSGVASRFEGGLRGAALVSGPSIRFGGPSFEAAPLGASLGIVNEGPVRGSLEGFKTMNILDIGKSDKGGIIEPLGSINFAPEPLNPTSAIAEAEAILANKPAAATVVNFEPAPPGWKPEIVIPSETRNLPAESVIPDREIAASLVSFAPRNDVVEQPVPVGAILPPTDSPVQPEVKRASRQVVSSAARQTEAIYAPAIQAQLVEEIIKPEQVNVSQEDKEAADIREEEQAQELKIKYVEDEAVSRRRVYQLSQAIEKAGAQAQEQGQEKIEGSLLKWFFAPEDSSNRSPIAEPGIGDGGLEKTYQVLAGRDYSSTEEAKQVAEATVADIKAVKKSQEVGKKVKEKDVALARKDPVTKRHPLEEVVARIVKKTKIEIKPGQKPAEVTTAVRTEEAAEGRVEDYPDLAAVFQKAA